MRLLFIALFAVLLMLGCYKEKDYNVDSKYSANLFNMSISKPTIMADAASTIQLNISFDNSVDSLKATTTFKTTAGVFVESGSNAYTVTPKYNYDSAKLIISIKLKSSQSVDSAIVSVTVAGFTKSIIIEFTRSYPEASKLTGVTLAVKPKNNVDGEVQFSNKISKVLGLPSLDNIVDMAVYDTLFNPIGSFKMYSNRSDASGTTSYIYVLGDSVMNGRNYTGRLYAISKTQTDQSALNFKRDTVILISSN